MRCKYCASENVYVLDSRQIRDGFERRRRCHCNDCGKRFNTIEQFEDVNENRKKNILNRMAMIEEQIKEIRNIVSRREVDL